MMPLGPHIRAFEMADATGVSDLISATLRTSNVRDYPEDFLSRVEASLAPPSLRELANERLILVAVEGDAIVGTASLGRDQLPAASGLVLMIDDQKNPSTVPK